MRWPFQILLVIVILGLSILAVWPHVPAIKKEANLLCLAWQNARSSEPEETAPQVAAEDREREAPRRQILAPPTISSAEPDPTPIDDPFILDTRKRAQEDPEAAMQWLQSQNSGSERLRGMLEVVALWAANDSQSALLWLESNAQGLARLETLSSGVELWAESNPTDAAAWIVGMANDGSKVAAAKSLAAKWAQTQPAEASAWVSGLPTGPLRDEASAALADAWVRVDAQSAAIWAFSEAEFNGNTGLLESTIQTFTKQSPEGAEAFLRDMAKVRNAPSVLANHVIARAEQDPAATAEWLANMSPSDPIYSTEYTNELMQVWAESDSIAASEWLSQQPSGTQRDAAIYGFSQSIQRYEPAAAAAWANTIDNPESRMARLTDSVRIWAQSDAEAAKEWVNNAELEPAVRQILSRNNYFALEGFEIPVIRLED